jgi:hypothetical protein
LGKVASLVYARGLRRRLAPATARVQHAQHAKCEASHFQITMSGNITILIKQKYEPTENQEGNH